MLWLGECKLAECHHQATVPNTEGFGQVVNNFWDFKFAVVSCKEVLEAVEEIFFQVREFDVREFKQVKRDTCNLMPPCQGNQWQVAWSRFGPSVANHHFELSNTLQGGQIFEAKAAVLG